MHLRGELYQPSLSEAIHDFQDRIFSELATRPVIKADGELHRFRLAKERKGKLSGAYIFYTIPIYSGWWSSWVSGASGTCTFKSQNKLTTAEKLALQQQVEINQAKRKAEQETQWGLVEKRALYIWSRSSPASKDHPYAVAKQMAVDGMRQSRGKLVIPLMQGGKITSLQFIDEKGEKKFLAKGKVSGSAFIFGDIRKPFDVCYLAESPSTAYSVYVLGGYLPTFSCMSLTNLKPVAVAIRAKFPSVKIIIACDNDYKAGTDKNVGIDEARKVATLVSGCEVSIPYSPKGKNIKVDWCDIRLMALGLGVSND